MTADPPATSAQKTAGKRDIQHFWETVYKTAYTDHDSRLTRETLLQALDDLEDMFRFREHMATIEMDLHSLSGKKVLEIGSGAGGHSALFSKYGAKMTSCDITFVRAAETQRKFDLLAEIANGCQAMQSDAENLPFADNSFDIVYSNGVLHHTEDTQRAIDEAYRVLKPGGRAVIMLYCKSSFDYWFNFWFCRGLLCGAMFKSRNWLGHTSEWIGSSDQTAVNPVTRCYTGAQLRRMFAAFRNLSFRKSEFYFYLIPKLGRIYRRWQIRRYGVHPGGAIVYGEPWPIWSPLEAWLGKKIGWGWFIWAEKNEEEMTALHSPKGKIPK